MLTGGRAGPRLQPLCVCGGPRQWPLALVGAEQTCDRLVQSRSLVDGATVSLIPVRPHGHLVNQLPEAMVPHCHAPLTLHLLRPGFPGFAAEGRVWGIRLVQRREGPVGPGAQAGNRCSWDTHPHVHALSPGVPRPSRCPWLGALDLHLPLGPPRPVGALPAPASAGIPASPACTGGDQAQRWAQPLSTLARLFLLPLPPRLCN